MNEPHLISNIRDAETNLAEVEAIKTQMKETTHRLERVVCELIYVNKTPAQTVADILGIPVGPLLYIAEQCHKTHIVDLDAPLKENPQ